MDWLQLSFQSAQTQFERSRLLCEAARDQRNMARELRDKSRELRFEADDLRFMAKEMMQKKECGQAFEPVSVFVKNAQELIAKSKELCSIARTHIGRASSDAHG